MLHICMVSPFDENHSDAIEQYRISDEFEGTLNDRFESRNLKINQTPIVLPHSFESSFPLLPSPTLIVRKSSSLFPSLASGLLPRSNALFSSTWLS